MVSKLAFICHLVAGLQFRLDRKLHAPEEWVSQFYVLLGFSAALSILLIPLRNSWKRVGLILVFQLIALVLIGIPEGEYLDIEFTLLTALVLETVFYTRHPYNKLFSAGIILLSIALQPSTLAWGRRLSQPAPNDLIVLGLYLSILAVIGDRLKSWIERHDLQVRQIRRLDEAAQQLINANMGFQQYADMVEEKSAEEERKRITREIHDTVAYTLINIMMMMREALLLAGKNKELKKLNQQVIDQAQTGLNETRRALRLLRSIEKRRLSTTRKIYKLVTAFANATGVRVSVEYGNLPDALDDSLDNCICHMLQEGMANAFRHGRATEIRVHLGQDDSDVLLYIRDNGTGGGGDHIEEGIGLSGMRERVESLGGVFRAGKNIDGFQISARIPHSHHAEESS